MKITTVKSKLLITALCATALAMPLATLPARADDATPAPSAAAAGTHFGGTVSAVDASAKTITVDSKKGGSKTFSLTDSSTLTGADGSSTTLADIKTGDHVRISYTTGSDGTTLTVTTLKVGGGKGGKGKKGGGGGGN
jgi:Cu/Ag efflux protein CusF